MTHGVRACARFVLGGMLVATFAACGGTGAPTSALTATTPATVATLAGSTPVATTPAFATAAPTPAASVIGPGNTGLPTVTGTLTLSGTYNGTALSGNSGFTDPIGLNGGGGYGCADFIAGTTSAVNTGKSWGWAVPAVTIGSHVIVASVSIGTKDWTGPGEYQGDKTNAQIDIDSGQADFADPGTAVIDLKVNADGSGNLTFTGLADENGGTGAVDGSVTWTCA